MSHAGHMGGRSRRSKIQMLMEAQGWICAHCEHPVDPELVAPHDFAPTLDHVIARARHGSNSILNLLAKHRICNEQKGDQPPTKRDHHWQGVVLAWLHEKDPLRLQAAIEAEIIHHQRGRGPMNKSEIFRITTERRDNMWIREAHIDCSTCNRSDPARADQSLAKAQPNAMKKFRWAGWELGKDRAHDVCPECVTKANEARREKNRKEFGMEHVAPGSLVDGYIHVASTLSPEPSVQPEPALEFLPGKAPRKRSSKGFMTWGGFNRRFNAQRSVLSQLAFHGRQSAIDGVDYVISLEPGTAQWRWTILSPDQPSKPTPDTSTAAVAAPIPEPANMNEAKTEPRADEPRTPTMADRRKVMDTIEASWNADKMCYQGSSTDKSIAERLGVPRKWVSDIRSEWFGAEANEASSKAIADVTAVIKRAEEMEMLGLKLATDAEALRADAKRILDSLKQAA